MADAKSVVKLARLKERPTALYYIERVFEGFIELHGDRLFADDRAVVGGIARLDGRPVTVIGIQKGVDLDDNILRNFGQPHPEGYRKALRLMRQAEKFGRPVISLISTPGAYCGIGAEERGQGEAIARNLCEMSALNVPMLSIIIGEGGSGGALALACADSVWMLENSIYSVLSPEGFASILWKDASRSGEAAELMRLTSKDLLELGVIEKILQEPEGGADKDPEQMADTMKTAISAEISRLSAIDRQELLRTRYERFRAFGEFGELTETD